MEHFVQIPPNPERCEESARLLAAPAPMAATRVSVSFARVGQSCSVGDGISCGVVGDSVSESYTVAFSGGFCVGTFFFGAGSVVSWACERMGGGGGKRISWPAGGFPVKTDLWDDGKALQVGFSWNTKVWNWNYFLWPYCGQANSVLSQPTCTIANFGANFN